jgi:hypothetical protein
MVRSPFAGRQLPVTSRQLPAAPEIVGNYFVVRDGIHRFTNLKPSIVAAMASLEVLTSWRSWKFPSDSHQNHLV